MHIDKNFASLITSTFDDRQSRILTMAGPTKFFHPKRGIEQGDPISPILWNIFYDSILKQLNNLEGYNFEGKNVSYMAYADDLILISKSEEKMRILLERVNNLLNTNEMEIQQKKSLVVSNFACREFEVIDQNNEHKAISRIDQDSTFKYLGAMFLIGKKELIQKNCMKS